MGINKEKIKAARIAIGSFIRERREQLQISHELLGELCGVTANTIKGFESGRFTMDVDMLFTIYSVLGIKPYFSYEMDEPKDDYRSKQIDNPERYHGFYFAENLALYPDQAAIIKLTHPRLFVRFNYNGSYFIDYEDWVNNQTDVQWLDPNDKPDSKEEIEYHLTDCWNFLALHEQAEENLFNEDESEED